MTRIKPKTSLSDLINAKLSVLSISRNDLMQRLGYANTDKGLRRFDEFIATGRITTHLLKGLPDVLGLNAVDVERAAAITRQQIEDAQEDSARERFRPHIQVLASWPNGKRMPFFIQAFAWDKKVLPMPDGFDRLSLARQVRQAARIVRRHFAENRSKLSAWDTITGYRLQITYDHSVVLNTDGTIREGFLRNPEPPATELQIRGKRLPVGIFTTG